LIEVLKKEIALKIKREIKSRGDCVFLSNAIFETLDVDLSYNTIRRFFNLLPSTKPSIKTLDTLAQFLVYRNYIDFTQNYKYKEKINITDIIYRSVERNKTEEIIILVNKTKKSSEDFTSLIIILLRELLHNENYILIDRLFKLKALNFNSFSYYEVLKLGNAIGLLIRKKPKIYQHLINNINFLDCIFLIFVDYSGLNNHYGNSLKAVEKSNIRYDITIFSAALLQFRNFLNKKNIVEININLADEKQLHPILRGRLLSLKLLSTNSNNTLVLMNAYHKSIKPKGDLISHYYELFTTSILLKNLDIMSFLVDKIESKFDLYRQTTHLNSFYLMCLFYYRLKGDNKNENKFFKFFKISECRPCYEEFINLIYLIYQYDISITKTKKMNVKTHYTNLNKKFNYSYFSDDFLLEYFNKDLLPKTRNYLQE